MEETDTNQRGGGWRDWMKEGEGINQRTGMHDPWTQTIVR